MNLFGDYLITWWQAGMLKIALIALGIILGATWPIVFKKPAVWLVLWILFLVFTVWLIIALWPQIF